VSVSAAIFDAFGTLIKIENGSHPYRRILQMGIEQGRRPVRTDAEKLLSVSLDLREAADFFGITVPAHIMTQLEIDLSRELEGIKPYDDGISAISVLRDAGVKVAICSNLAKPYAKAIERLYPNLDGYIYSFEVGAIKPTHEIYREAVANLAVAAQQIWMIGDSKRCDCDGPNDFGMHGFYLDRSGKHDYHTLKKFAADIVRERQINLV
jgi:HAD superfamily hydrolase (TIGR01549 family)